MPFVTTHALLLNGAGRAFMMRRAANCRDEHGRWDIISGGLDEGWRAEDNIRREVAEETGLDLVRLEFIGYREVFRPPDVSPHPHTVALDFVARLTLFEAQFVHVAEPHKFDAHGWFRTDELPSPLHSQVEGFAAKYASHWRSPRSVAH